MKGPTIVLLATACLAASLSAAATTDPAMDQLLACMGLRAGSPEQKSCLLRVQQMRAPAPAPAPAMTAPRAMKSSVVPSSPSTPPAVITVPAEVKMAASVVGLNGAPNREIGAIGINVGDLKGLDLETAMMMIQSQRAKILDGQLKSQLDGIQARNDQIAAANGALSQLRGVRPGSVTPALVAEVNGDFARARFSPSVVGKTAFDASFTQAQIDATIEALKGTIDAMNSSQQMDMLRLQSLTNKRNEAFDLMSNFIKKMADSRSSILGNMR